MRMFTASLTALLAAATFAAPISATAQSADTYPSKPIRVIVPYPPGGGTDVIARIVQERFQTLMGQPMIIENRGGAAGSIGTDIASKAAPDGYTVLFTLSSHTINPSIYSKLPFDTEKDFAPVSMVASLPQILVANQSFPPNTVAELVKLAKEKPGSISFASVGNGSPGHLAGELLKLRTGTEMTHIPYRGGGPAVTDVMGGQVPLLWVSIPAAAQFVKSGKLKALAVSTRKRSAAFPDVPTMQEAGVPDFEVDSWYAMFVPAKTPRYAIDKLNRAINTAINEPDVKEKLLAQGGESAGGPPEALGKVVTDELVRWGKLTKAANIRVD
ncbi:MAG: tripartite tricarboxylate transporter substrate binding protein [Gammaproteobacteria bacterium]|nr:tripartite tricarboxylate transporter substrate binding protein [Gammaproteobacteria bacterium]MBU1444511.1 tripartite tricarboxylate transporter substrate binding protein [Gammaproteobacteria bacterium]MBU2288968.1 tripartite tricarboxylate transporter substrate binding protein [Gammaproteobacteria bacterium]MBU2409971.1 tripartite tricarboxylate transporter substrate binding protein [Gammaproteobacteria bacterium]